MSAGYDPGRIHQRLRPVRLGPAYRLIRRKHRRSLLGVVPAPSRFSDPAGRYAVLYAAEAVRCAFWEALARNRFTRRRRREIPRRDVEDRLIVSLRSVELLNLIDLRRDGPIRIGAPPAVAHDANHTAGRALSAAAYRGAPEADGFLFESRFTGHACVAVFDRAIGKLEAPNVAPLVEDGDFLDMLSDYDIVLTTPL